MFAFQQEFANRLEPGRGLETRVKESRVLNRIARLVTRFPWRVALIALLFTAVAGAFGGPVAGQLKGGGFQDPASESSRAADMLAEASNTSADGSLVAVVGGDAAKVSAVVKRLRAEPGVASAEPVLASTVGNKTLVAVAFARHADSQATAKAIVTDFASDPAVKLGGATLANQQVGAQVQLDLGKAELMAFPILFLLSLWIFRGAVAALLPLMVGGITILGAFLGLRVVNSFVPMSVFAVNLVTGMGLGLAIDYSLFMLSRHREELAAGRSPADAVRVSLLTAGRTILFSALTVAAALASLLVFPLRFLYSMGVGGIMVALLSAAVALIVLPSVLLLLGPRVNALAPRRWQRSLEAGSGFWLRLAEFVMRRPVAVALGATAVLLVLGLPFSAVRFTSVDASVLPATASARQVSESLQKDFPAAAAAPIWVIASGRAEQVRTTAARIRDIPGVTGVRLQPAGPEVWRIDVGTSGGELSDSSRRVVTTIRDLRPSERPLVGGGTADFIDLQASLANHLGTAIALVVGATLILLFLMTGSVLLPVKAVLMNVLTLSASYGVLVLVFQDGNLEGVLSFASQGALESTQPVLLFAIVFGLSTDYGVFLLGRIKEAHDGGASNREAVTMGIARTGRIVTAAALLFCVAVGAFATSQIVFIKELGIGTAAGVMLDATIVRALLVPSLMALLGPWNWWAPRSLRRLHSAFGLRDAPIAEGELRIGRPATQ